MCFLKSKAPQTARIWAFCPRKFWLIPIRPNSLLECFRNTPRKAENQSPFTKFDIIQFFFFFFGVGVGVDKSQYTTIHHQGRMLYET